LVEDSIGAAVARPSAVHSRRDDQLIVEKSRCQAEQPRDERM